MRNSAIDCRSEVFVPPVRGYGVDEDDAFVPIPGLGHADVAVVQSLLAAAGFDYHVHDGFGEWPGVLFIRFADLPAVKVLLSEYRVRSPRDDQMPIPW